MEQSQGWHCSFPRQWLANRAMRKGQRAATRGELPLAQKHFARAIALTPRNALAHVCLGDALCAAGQVTEAIACYQTAVEIEPKLSQGHRQLATALLESGDFPRAEYHFQQSLDLDPNDAATLVGKSELRIRQNQLAAAEPLLERALAINPQHLEGRVKLAQLALRGNNPQRVKTLLKDFSPTKMLAPMFWETLGEAYWQVGRVKNAIDCLRNAAFNHPDPNRIYSRIGKAYAEVGHYEEALDWWSDAVKANPHDENTFRKIGLQLNELGRSDEAVENYQQAALATGDAGFKLAALTAIPPIIRSHKDMADVRAKFSTEISHLNNANVHGKNPFNGLCQIFYLASQGENDRELMEQFARLYAKTFPSVNFTAPHCRNLPVAPAAKVKLGVFSRFLRRQHPVAFCFFLLISKLADNPAFEVFVISGANEFEPDAYTSNKVFRHITIALDLEEAQQTIAALALDVLIYTDIGMDPLSYALAFARLAPTQCVMQGHPVTTGIPTMDYFITSSMIEPANAGDHYSENLVMLNSIPAVYPPVAIPPDDSVASFPKIDLGKHIYLVPSRLQKIHPDFDAVIAAILARDPVAQLVFFCGTTNATWEALLRERWARHGKINQERVIFIDWLPNADFLRLARAAKVVLDTFPFGLGSTVVQVFSVGTPIVTLPAAYFRGRITAGIYRAMNMEDVVTHSLEGYVALAVQLATQAEPRRALSDRILANKHQLIQNYACCEQLATWLLARPNVC